MSKEWRVLRAGGRAQQQVEVVAECISGCGTWVAGWQPGDPSINPAATPADKLMWGCASGPWWHIQGKGRCAVGGVTPGHVCSDLLCMVAGWGSPSNPNTQVR